MTDPTRNGASTNGTLPELPGVARKPLAWVPPPARAAAIAAALNALFSATLRAGELEFLAARVMNVIVTDAGLGFSLTLERNRLRVREQVPQPDLSVEGTVYTFLLLASRKEDADTLFFRRMLKTSGDTELGLRVKNFLDGLEPETLPGHRIIEPLLYRSLALADGVEGIRRRLSRSSGG
ncbi:MAG TPA: SCP2 sterol-binding domain-containing protein [Woeseiaceae bacterium]|nr:SCP2 sterol-binding domain-containing protein [Woeseiaceae bacterium]